MMEEFTIKQISEYLEVSKPTAQKIADRLQVKPIRIDNTNCRFYNLEDTERIIADRKPDFDFAVLRKDQNETAKPQNEAQSFAQSTEKLQNETANPEDNIEEKSEETEKPQNSNSVNELELLRQTVAIIEKQLEEKDKQLQVKDKQIQDLSDRLAEAMQLTGRQQYITAADKASGLLETDSKEVVEEQPPKKSFWKRLFRL